MKCIAPRCGAPAEVGAVFCGPHLAAPAAQRGGWLSAARRREQLGHKGRASARVELDASCVFKRLWIGGAPPIDHDLPNFDVLILCAQEVQPTRLAYRGRVIRVPIADGALAESDVRNAVQGAMIVGRHLAAGRRILVTSKSGWNRAPFVACLALGTMTRASSDKLIGLVRERRGPDALSRSQLVEILGRAINR